MHAIRRNPVLAFGALAVLVLLQVMGLLGQFRAGFVPLRAPPTRVPFSWDMFSIEISRCDVEWSPALPVGKGYAHFRDFGAPFEWDPVFNAPDGYFYTALAGCNLRNRATKTHVNLTCATPKGVLRNDFDCP